MNLNLFGIIIMFLFIFLLTIGFIYELYLGAMIYICILNLVNFMI